MARADRSRQRQGRVAAVAPRRQQRELEFSATANISPGRHLSVLRDVTERKHLEHQLHQSAKMEALGKLAGGLAHDFNNLLSVILGYGQFALEGLPENAPIRDELRQVLHAGERATALTRQLLALSRTQLASPRVLDLNDAVIRVHRLLRPLLGEDIELIAELSEGLWPVRIDLGQLEQILVNLAINAREAMPSGGKLFFSTSNRMHRNARRERVARARPVCGAARARHRPGHRARGARAPVRAVRHDQAAGSGHGLGLGLATTQLHRARRRRRISVENATRTRHDASASICRARPRTRAHRSTRSTRRSCAAATRPCSWSKTSRPCSSSPRACCAAAATTCCARAPAPRRSRSARATRADRSAAHRSDHAADGRRGAGDALPADAGPTRACCT